jgi:uncharacterized membrane protein YdfJ with MMPL/SSD domain
VGAVHPAQPIGEVRPAPRADGETPPALLGAVLAISLLLLIVMLRSVLVPLKAVLLSLVSVAAAYGVIVAVFQWGWGEAVMTLLGRGSWSFPGRSRGRVPVTVGA